MIWVITMRFHMCTYCYICFVCAPPDVRTKQLTVNNAALPQATVQAQKWSHHNCMEDVRKEYSESSPMASRSFGMSAAPPSLSHKKKTKWDALDFTLIMHAPFFLGHIYSHVFFCPKQFTNLDCRSDSTLYIDIMPGKIFGVTSIGIFVLRYWW